MERRSADGVAEMVRPLERDRRDTMAAARRDPLSGFGNRAAFNERLERDRRRADVLCIEVESFDSVDDGVLAEVARRLELAVPGGASVYRIGGDFVVVCAPTGDDPAHRNALAERIVAWVAAPIDMDGRDVSVGVHVGVAQAHELGLNQTVRDALDALRIAQQG